MLLHISKVSNDLGKVVNRWVDSPREEVVGKVAGRYFDERKKWCIQTDEEYSRIEAARYNENGLITFLAEDKGLGWSEYEYQRKVEKNAPVTITSVLYGVAGKTARLRGSTLLFALRDKINTSVRGFSEPDVWSLHFWISQTLESALQEYAHTLGQDSGLVGTLYVAANRIGLYRQVLDVEIFESSSPWENTPLRDVSITGFTWLCENFPTLASDGVFLREWAGQCSEALAELADMAHGYPDPFENGYDGWVSSLRQTAEQLDLYAKRANVASGTAGLVWVNQNIDSLWD